MKRFLINFSIIITLISLLIISVPFILRISGLEQPAKEYLLKTVLGNSDQQLDLQHVHIGLGTLNISDVSYVSENERTELLIENIRFDFNLLSFFKSPLNPKSAVDEIVIDQPRLIFLNRAQNPDTLIPEIKKNDIFETLTNLPDVQHLRVVNGKIIFEQSNGGFIALAQNLKGRLREQDGLYRVHLQGNVFSTEDENFELSIDLDRKSRRYNVFAKIKEYNFEHSMLPHLTREVIVHGGLSDGFVNISGSLAELDSLVMQGKIDVENASMSFEGETIDSLYCNVVFEDQSIFINELNGRIRHVPFNANATILSVFKPQLKGRLQAQSFPIRTMDRFMNVDMFNGSTVNVNLDFDLSPSGFNVQSNLFSDDFSLYTQDFSEFRAHVEVNPDGVFLDTLNLAHYEAEIGGRASFGFSDRRLNLELDGLYQTDTHELLDRIDFAINRLQLALNVDTKRGVSNGSLNYTLTNIDTLLNITGAIRGNRNELIVRLDTSNIKDFDAFCIIENYMDRPVIKNAALHNFPFQVFTSQKLIKDIFGSLSTSARLKGTINDLSGDVLIGRKEQGDTLLALKTSIKNLLDDVKNIKGNIELANLNGQFEADISPGFLGSYFNFGSEVQGKFFLDISNTEQLSGELQFKRFKILHAFWDQIDKSDYRSQAHLDGNIQLSGNLEHPLVKGEIRGDRFVFNDVGYYQPVINFYGDHTRFVADSLMLYHNNRPKISGSYSWQFLNNQISGKLNGHDINISSFRRTLGIESEILSGSADFEARIKGQIDRPSLELSAICTDGKLDDIDFEKLEVRLNDELTRSGDFLDFENHRINIQHFFMMDQGRYHLQAAGSFPLNTSDEVDLVLNFDGDILGMIKHWEPFFSDGASLAEIRLKLKGSADDIRIAAADVKLERGELWLRNVAPHIEDISADITLLEGSNKVNINALSARVDEDVLTIKTVRNIVTASGRELEPWHFKGIDLDFGVLAMKTSGDGVRLFIPGLMTESAGGKLHLSGKTEQETFYFAGPIKHPLAYGQLTLNDSRLTYPFLTSNKPGAQPSPAVQFLRNMDWDVLVRAGEDVTYVRDIPAYIDNVQAELTIDDASKGLHFTGIIDEGTFKPQGALSSSRGRLEYLDQNFKVDYFSVDFLRNRSNPEVSGRAWTTIRDSVGAAPKTIYLQLYAIDAETGEERPSGDWEDFKFKLVSADPTVGETQEQVLGYLGYSVENIKEKATNVGGALTERYLIRPLLRPLERALERSLGIDFIRFNSNIARNLFYSGVRTPGSSSNDPALISPFLASDAPYLFLMSSSEVTLGKYLTQDLYLTYTGQIVSIYDDTETGFDFNHSVGLEYRFLRNILLEFEYDREFMGYYNILNERQYLEDFKVRLRHSFTF